MSERAAAGGPGAGQPDTAPVVPPRLVGLRLAVREVEQAADFFVGVLGLSTLPGSRPGSLDVPLGEGHRLVLVPGGRDLPLLHDRNEKGGVIPILRTRAVDDLVAGLDKAGVEWVNRPRDYEMMGTGRIAYLHGADHHVLGIQQRLDDSTREEDVAFRRRTGLASASARYDLHGIGWMIFQVADINAARVFYADAFSWGERRGSHLGSMMAITETTILQTWLEGAVQPAGRDLGAEPVLPLVAAASDLTSRVLAAGGSRAGEVDGLPSVLDPEGHAWLVLDPRRAASRGA